MQITHLSSDQRDKWDALVAESASFALMQSWEWGNLKETRGWQILRVGVEDDGQLIAGAQVMIRSLPLGSGSLAYVPRGPVGDWLSEKAMKLLVEELKQIAYSHNVLFLRIEPPIPYNPATSLALKQFDFVPSKFTNQPRATLIVDITPDPDTILAKTKKIVQNRIRHAEDNGVTVRRGREQDLPAFYKLMQVTGERNGFLPRTYDYYEQQWHIFSSRDEAVLFLAYYGNRLLGARMSFRFADHVAALHACSSLEHSELRANWLLAWKEIEWAKSLGCRTFDLWGIPDEVGEAAYQGKDLPTEGAEGGLWGVYQFKRGFTRNVVYYLGAYDYVRAPLLYKPVMQILNNQYLDRLTAMMDSVKHNHKASSH